MVLLEFEWVSLRSRTGWHILIQVLTLVRRHRKTLQWIGHWPEWR